MERVYPNRINWENEPSTATPIDEDNLNKIDYAVYELDGRIIEQQGLIDGLQEYETRAADSAAAAALSEQNAKESEDNAKASETAAKLSEDSAKASEDNAKTSETNAKTSEDNAAASSVAAADSAAAALISESHAKSSEDAAKASEEKAAESEEKADIFAKNAGQSSINASRSATEANRAATEAANHESNSEAWAVGQRMGVDVASDDITFENNSKWYAMLAKMFNNAVENYYNSITDIQSDINDKLALAEFDVDDNGNLIYTDNSGYIFTVDDNGNLNWEVA